MPPSQHSRRFGARWKRCRSFQNRALARSFAFSASKSEIRGCNCDDSIPDVASLHPDYSP
jgi:hypothetical protein